MIPGLPQVGGVEMLILLAIVLLFFGAKRVPELGRSLGKGLQEFRKGKTEAGEEDAAELQARKMAQQEEPSPTEASREEENVRTEQSS
jgi:sec-independent protein translocase protein TatA